MQMALCHVEQIATQKTSVLVTNPILYRKFLAEQDLELMISNPTVLTNKSKHKVTFWLPFLDRFFLLIWRIFFLISSVLHHRSDLLAHEPIYEYFFTVL